MRNESLSLSSKLCFIFYDYYYCDYCDYYDYYDYYYDYSKRFKIINNFTEVILSAILFLIKSPIASAVF